MGYLSENLKTQHVVKYWINFDEKVIRTLFFVSLRCHSFIGDNVTAAELKKDIYIILTLSSVVPQNDLFRIPFRLSENVGNAEIEMF